MVQHQSCSFRIWLSVTVLCFLISTKTVIATDMQAQESEEESQVLSTEKLFDLLDLSNRSNEEEVYPPLSVVEHYSISWSVAMSFAAFNPDFNDDEKRKGSSSYLRNDNNDSIHEPVASWDTLFYDRRSTSRFQFNLRLSCPKATRLVLGFIDEQGRTKQIQNIHKSDNKPPDSVACGPPMDMSRNVLECRGIPGNNIIQKDSNTGDYRFVFQTALEVTCLAYRNQTAVVSKSYAEEETGGSSKNTLGLIVSTGKQQIKTQTNLVLTESFYATKITNLTRYVDPSIAEMEQPVEYWDGESSRSPTNQFIDKPVTDASSFRCNHNPVSGTIPATSSCPRTQQKPGLCTRQITCYYSAPSKDGSCLSGVESMSLSSVRDDRRLTEITHQQYDGAEHTGVSSSDPKNATYSTTTLQAVRKGSESNKKPDKRTKFHRMEEHEERRLSPPSLYNHESRYRLLWTVHNLGCSSFPLMVDITCANAAAITFKGSPSESALNDMQSTRHPVECYQSLLHEKTLHCRRVVPEAFDSNNYYQQVLSLDFQCTQTVRDAEEVLPTVVSVDVLEKANIECQNAPALVASALAVVPVAIDQPAGWNTQELINGEEGVGDTDHYVLFPPPNTGTSFDPTTSVTCPPCQDEYSFHVNYNNNIGNKVAQISTGCKNVASCHASAFDLPATITEGEGGNGGVCVNTLSPTKMTFNDDAQFSSRVYPASSSSLQIQRSGHLALGIVFWVAIPASFIF